MSDPLKHELRVAIPQPARESALHAQGGIDGDLCRPPYWPAPQSVGTHSTSGDGGVGPIEHRTWRGKTRDNKLSNKMSNIYALLLHYTRRQLLDRDQFILLLLTLSKALHPLQRD
jgi:hypothetical protein